MTPPAPTLSPHEIRLRNRSILLAVALPVALALFLPELGEGAILLAKVLLWLSLPVYLWVKPFCRWALGEGSDLRCLFEEVRVGIPSLVAGQTSVTRVWVTLGLIAANVAVFMAFGGAEALTISACQPSRWAWTNWTSMFAHADWGHLLGNMLFLWIFAAPLEIRIGSTGFLFDYLAMGTVAAALGLFGAALIGDCTPALGASGAISGVMGIFLVRCHFSRVPVPIFGMAGPFAVRINAVLVCTVFFLRDLLGAREQLAGADLDTGYWAHLGGYFCGLAIGFGRRYYREGLREGLAERMQSGPRDGDFGRRRGAREVLLELAPDHPEALLSRARDASRFLRREDAAADYVCVIGLLLAQRQRRRAAEVFLEYFQKYMRPVALERQLSLTPLLVSLGETDVAARCLELAARAPGADPTLRERALAAEVRLLKQLGLDEAAASRGPARDASG